jgi:hypothetical protein
MKQISVEFERHDKVMITAVNAPGFVDKLSISNDGTMYQVVYWIDGKRNETWVYASELQAMPE